MSFVSLRRYGEIVCLFQELQHWCALIHEPKPTNKQTDRQTDGWINVEDNSCIARL